MRHFLIIVLKYNELKTPMLHDRFELVEVAWLSSFKEFVEQFRVPFMSKKVCKTKKNI